MFLNNNNNGFVVRLLSAAEQDNKTHAYTGAIDGFTHLSVLLVLTDRGI
jgi:hypothetical protein